MHAWLRTMVLTALVFTAGAAAAQPIAEVTRIRGYAAVERDRAVVPLALRDAVNLGDAVITGGDGRLQILFTDGSLINVGSGTRVFITWYTDDPATHRRLATLDLLTGIVRAVVTDRGPESGFEVRMPSATASVRGTELVTIMDPGHAAVLTLSGEVWVRPHSDPEPIRLTDGEGVDIRDPGGEFITAEPWNAERVREMLDRTDSQ